MPTRQAPPFEEHCSRALEGLRTTLTELYQAAGADPDTPQVVSRELGVNRNTSWKVSRIVRAGSPYAVMQHLPGVAGLQILLDAFAGHGAPRERVEAVRGAIAEFERMVELHAGDRQTLELMLDSLAPADAQSEPLEVSRKLAFKGNSGVWGIQAKLRLRAVFLAPNPEDASLLDIAQVSGLVGLRRFRHGASWPLFVREDFNDDGTPRESAESPLDPAGDSETLLMPEFCSSPLPEVRATPTHLGMRYEQVEGELGNRGLTNLVYGGYRRAFAPRYRDEKNERGELFTSINAPVEHLLFDVIAHRDLLRDGLELEALVLQTEHTSPFYDSGRPSLPCPETVRALGSGPPRLVNALAPRYGEIAERVFERLAWEPEDFGGLRFEMKYPPLPSTVLLSYGLPARP